VSGNDSYGGREPGADPSAVPPPPGQGPSGAFVPDEATPGVPPPGGPLLRRSHNDRVLFGVAGGLGRYLGIDPIILRIAFVLLAVFGGSGVLLYLIALIVIPEERADEAVGQGTSAGAFGNVAVVIGIVLVLVGSLALLRQVIPGLGDLVGPLLLVLVGVLVLLASRR
jgi:phage shock protein C